MIIRDVDIEKYGVIIKPFDSRNLTPNGYDLSIGCLRVYKEDGSKKPVCTDFDLGFGEKVTIKPGHTFLVGTKESLIMPDNVCGNIWIRSTYARKGIFGSFGIVDAGYRGDLTLSLCNQSNTEVEIAIGDRIAQIVFTMLNDNAAMSYEKRSGNYQDQKSITITKERYQ